MAPFRTVHVARHRLLVAFAALVSLLITADAAFAQVPRNDLWVTDGQVFASRVVNDVLYLGGQFSQVGPPTGGWVPIDATTGAVIQPVPNVVGSVFVAVSDGNGGWYLGGNFSTVHGQPRNNLAHIDANGSLTSWNPGTNGTVRALVLYAGTLYLDGEFTTVAGVGRNYLAAVDTTAGTPSNWNPSPDQRVFALGAYADVIYVGGDFTTISGVSRGHVCGLDANSGAATNWKPNANGPVYALALRVNVVNLTVVVYAGGDFTSIGGTGRSHIASIDATQGSATFSAATTWNPNANGIVNVLRVVGNTIPTVYAGGAFYVIGNAVRRGIAAINASGGATAFNPTGADSTAQVWVTAIAPAGSVIYVGGSFTRMGSQNRRNLAALDASTGNSTAWDPEPNGDVRALAVNGNTVFAGGILTSIGGVKRNNLAALDLNTGAAMAWNPDANGTVFAIQQAGGLLYAGGSFTVVGGQTHAHLAQLDAQGGVGQWDAAVNGDVHAIVVRPINQLRNQLYLGGLFNSVLSTIRNHLAAVTDDPFPQLASWNPNVNSYVNALSSSGSTIYAGGAFTSAGGITRNRLAAFDLSGNLLSWSPNPNAEVLAVLATGNTVYVGGNGFTTLGGQTRLSVGAVDGTTGLATPWNPGTNGAVSGLGIDGATVYVTGSFTTLGGQPRSSLGAVDATGAVLPWTADLLTFYDTSTSNPGFGRALTVVPGAVYVMGQFQGAKSTPHAGVAGLYQSALVVDRWPIAGMNRLQAAPNPFRSSLELRFALPRTSEAEVRIHDLAGRMVRHLHEGVLAAGEHRLFWDGRDDAGRPAPAGVYLVRMSAPEVQLETKLLRIR